MNKFPGTGNIFLIAAIAMVATFAVLGTSCTKKPAQAKTKYSSVSEMNAHKLPYTWAYINYIGTLTETKMSAVNRAGEVDFILEVDGVQHDIESYTYDDFSFRYTGNEEEVYSPGLLLLKFPLNVGDSWDWKGTYRLGGRDRKASAVVVTSSESLMTHMGSFETVLVVCNLQIESGAKDPAKKELKFWFAPEKGLIRKEIEHMVSREPMNPSHEESE